MKSGFVKERIADYVLGRNDVAIVAIRPTKTKDLVQLVFVQHVEREGRVNLLREQMKGHEAFEGGNLRPFWQNFTMKALQEHLPQLVPSAKKAIESGDYVAVDMRKPTMYDSPIVVQVIETLVARESDVENIELSAKQDGNGNYLCVEEDGVLYAIFTRTVLTYADQLKHQFILSNASTSDLAEVNVKEIAVSSSSAEDKQAEKAQASQQEIVEPETADAETVEA